MCQGRHRTATNSCNPPMTYPENIGISLEKCRPSVSGSEICTGTWEKTLKMDGYTFIAKALVIKLTTYDSRVIYKLTTTITTDTLRSLVSHIKINQGNRLTDSVQLTGQQLEVNNGKIWYTPSFIVGPIK